MRWLFPSRKWDRKKAANCGDWQRSGRRWTCRNIAWGRAKTNFGLSQIGVKGFWNKGKAIFSRGVTEWQHAGENAYSTNREENE